MIFDTNALSAMADGDPAIKLLLQASSRIELPVIVLGEYRFGIEQSRNRIRYSRWLKAMTPLCIVLEIDESTAEQYAAIRAELKSIGRPIPSNDLWIAALTRQHAVPLLSRDQHFDFVPRLKRMKW